MLGRLAIPSDFMQLTRDTDVVEVPSGNTSALPQGEWVTVIQELGGDFTIRTRYGLMYRIDGKDADALGREPVLDELESRYGPNDELSDELVELQLKKCYDPEIPINIVDLGLVYECVRERLPQGGYKVAIQMTLTAPACGMGEVLVADVKRKLGRLPQVREVKVDLVFEPPWDASMMSEAARLQTGMM